MTSPTPAPRSICMVSDDFLPAATGVGTHLQSICRHLVAAGHRVSLLTTRRRGESAVETWHGVRVYRMPTVRIAGFDQAIPGHGRLAEVLASERPDLVHLHYLGLMMLRTIAAARERGLPLVYTYHMTEDHLTQPWLMRPFRPLLARAIVRVVNRMDSTISVSQGLTDTLPGKGITSPVTTISNPVDLPDLHGLAAAPRPPGFVALYAGRLEPEKNLPFLLRSFARLATSSAVARLWIAGRGSQHASLVQLATTLGIADRTEFLGFLDRTNLSRRYLACDAFVLPSLVETQGLVAMEAAWAGKPVVVADSVVSCRELVAEGRSGYIVPAGDTMALAERLSKLAGDPDLRRRMGEHGRQMAAQWQPAAIVPRILDVYAASLARSRRPVGA